MKRNTVILILFLAVLMGCKPTVSLLPTKQSTRMATTTPTITDTFTPTATMESTATLIPTETATSTSTPRPPTPTSTITPTPTEIPPYETLVTLFEYDHEAPLSMVVESEEIRGEITIQTVQYYGAEHPAYHKAIRVSAYLVLPPGNGPFPAIIYLHAGMMSKDQYLDEAILLAQHGVVCLVIDGPISSVRGSRLDPFDVPRLRDAYIRTVIDLRRGIDLLASLPQVDVNRLAFVGHSYGATWGGVLAGVETRLKAFVLMAGYAQVSENDTPQVPELDAIRYLAYAPPVAFLFQFAENDAFIDHEEAQRYFDTANEPKTMLWYDTDHFTLQFLSQEDRLNWLAEQLRFENP